MNSISFVIFDQRNRLWRNTMYSSRGDPCQTILSSGSIPTLCADVVATFKDRYVTPKSMAALSVEWGCRTRDTGTSWAYFPNVAEHFGFAEFVHSSNIDEVIKCIANGGCAICQMKQQYWSRAGGTYIFAHYCDNKRISAYNSLAVLGAKQIDAFERDLAHCFCYYP